MSPTKRIRIVLFWMTLAVSGCRTNQEAHDAGSCFTTMNHWSESVSAIAPARECAADDDCVLVSASFECERAGRRVALFLQGCDFPARRTAVAEFENERDRMAAELCDSLPDPFCWVEGCNVDGGTPGVRCVDGLCTRR